MNSSCFRTRSILKLLAFDNGATEYKIKFEEAYTIRPDGAKNIAHVSIENKTGVKSKYFDSIMKWCGPMWNGNQDIVLWQINSEWSTRNLFIGDYQKNIERDLKLLHRFISSETLSQDEYAFMKQKGYIRGGNGVFDLAVIWLKNKEINDQFLNLANEIKTKHSTELKDLKTDYIRAVLASTPKQVQKMQAYGLQHMFSSDGCFLLYTIKELLENGRLKLPTDTQSLSLSTIIMPSE